LINHSVYSLVVIHASVLFVMNINGLKFLKQHGSEDFPITVTVHLSLPSELDQNPKVIFWLGAFYWSSWDGLARLHSIK
jgi:hypothetical protein